MKKRHFRGPFPAASRPPMPAPNVNFQLNSQSVNVVMRIAASSGADPSQVLNDLIGCAVMASQALHLMLGFGGVLMARPASAPEPVAAEAEELDERTTEEKLAELRDVAEGHPSLVAEGTSEDAEA